MLQENVSDSIQSQDFYQLILDEKGLQYNERLQLFQDQDSSVCLTEFDAQIKDDMFQSCFYESDSPTDQDLIIPRDQSKTETLSVTVTEEVSECLQDIEAGEKQSEIKSDASDIEQKSYTKPGKRKTEREMKLLISYYHMYEGHWDENNFKTLIEESGFKKKQLNKWFWDRKKRETEAIKHRRLNYPGLIFTVTQMKTGQDLTPSFDKLARHNPIFAITKVKHQ